MNRNLSILTKIGAVIFIAMFSILIFALPIPNGAGSAIDPSIIVIDNDIIVNEEFKLYVAGIPEDSEVTWDMGDGTELEGSAIEHSFNRSEEFQVLVTVKNGLREGTANVTIPVKCSDRYTSESCIKPFKKMAVRAHAFTIDSHSLVIHLQESISPPSFKVDIQLRKATGEYTVYCLIDNEKTDIKYEIVKYEGKMKDHFYHSHITPEDYSMKVPNPIIIQGFVICESGDCPEIDISIQVRY